MPSLDALERQSLQGLVSPSDKQPESVSLSPEAIDIPLKEDDFSLDGEWEYLETEAESSEVNWSKAFKGKVPSSVHQALFEAEKIPDPTIGCNQVIAREHSYKNWWLRKKFSFKAEKGAVYYLHFKGIADRCQIWLNGQEIGNHEGMFGGPDFEVTTELQENNILIVHLFPIPFESGGYYHEENQSWKKAVVINCVYGWHYSNLPTLGIWDSVFLEKIPAVKIEDPFIFAEDALQGRMRLALKFHCLNAESEGQLFILIKPHNFKGDSFSYLTPLTVEDEEEKILSFILPKFQLWWPNGLGKPSLYELEVAFKEESGTVSSWKKLFGIRSLKMEPLPGGEKPNLYNWQIVVNDRASFVRGTGWCTMDALMNFTHEKYDHFLSLANQQHVQMLRAWGCGMPESDYFYQRCSELGIMVMQEWPTAWNSHVTQPFSVLKDTVRRSTVRLRDFPALFMYGGGNESDQPFGEAIDMMLKASVELDGTRPFHRGEPWGGSQHDYGCWWGREPLDHHLTATAPFYGEFGLASLPIKESFLKYMPEESLDNLELEDNADFAYHTPVFGHADDLGRLKQFAGYFMTDVFTWDELIVSTEIAQALAVRRVLERARTRYPECSGALYYKMNDNFPAVSWSSVDFYGAPKLSHYIFQNSFEPLHACMLFEKENYYSFELNAKVYLLDDQGSLFNKDWLVKVQAFDGKLHLIKEVEMRRKLKVGFPILLGEFSLTSSQTKSVPLFFVCSIICEGKRVSRSFYFENSSVEKGSLFHLPITRLKILKKDENRLILCNIGELPAVGAQVICPGMTEKVFFSSNFFWLEPQESQIIEIKGAAVENCQAEALNCRLNK